MHIERVSGVHALGLAGGGRAMTRRPRRNIFFRGGLLARVAILCSSATVNGNDGVLVDASLTDRTLRRICTEAHPFVQTWPAIKVAARRDDWAGGDIKAYVTFEGRLRGWRRGGLRFSGRVLGFGFRCFRAVFGVSLRLQERRAY